MSEKNQSFVGRLISKLFGGKGRPSQQDLPPAGPVAAKEIPRPGTVVHPMAGQRKNTTTERSVSACCG
jgi:hypothetical protein